MDNELDLKAGGVYAYVVNGTIQVLAHAELWKWMIGIASDMLL